MSTRKSKKTPAQKRPPEASPRETMRVVVAADLQDLLFTEAKADSAGVEEEIIAADGGSAEDAEFAPAIGCSAGELESILARNEYLCLVHLGRRFWPRWQLRVPELRQILAVFAERGISPWSVAIWCTTPTGVLSLSNTDHRLDVRENDSPLSLMLREGRAALPLVLRHATRFGEQGAT